LEVAQNSGWLTTRRSTNQISGQGEKSATHFAAHRKNSADLYRFFQQETSFNPFVVGSTPARPTI
jgi:hypothetical protein